MRHGIQEIVRIYQVIQDLVRFIGVSPGQSLRKQGR